jgi:hypothetical protein
MRAAAHGAGTGSGSGSCSGAVGGFGTAGGCGAGSWVRDVGRVRGGSAAGGTVEVGAGGCAAEGVVRTTGGGAARRGVAATGAPTGSTARDGSGRSVTGVVVDGMVLAGVGDGVDRGGRAIGAASASSSPVPVSDIVSTASAARVPTAAATRRCRRPPPGLRAGVHGA